MVYKNALFELAGRSLEAAKRLEAEVVREPYTNDAGLVERLIKEDPELLRQTGLNSPAVQVFKGKGTLPRAYREYPQIFESAQKSPRYFMYSPIDYKGQYFKPEDAREITDAKEEHNIGNLLFAGGWLGNAPILPIRKAGVATPADYVPKDYTSEFNQYSPPVSRNYRCFIAKGRSLEIIQDLEKRKSEYDLAVGKVRNHLHAVTEEQFPEISKTLPPGESVRACVGTRYGGSLGNKTEFSISVRRDGKLDIMTGGKPVPVLANPHYKFHIRYGGEYLVRPRHTTPEGKITAALMKAVPPTPSIADYAELHADYSFAPTKMEEMVGVNGAIPQVMNFNEQKILRYTCDDSAPGKFIPPDAQEISTELYHWLDTDKADRNMGVALPPVPPELRREYESLIPANPVQVSVPAPKAPGMT